MSLDAGPLLDRMRPTLARLTADLQTQAEDPGIASALRAEHAREVEAQRTADPFEVWVAFRVTQISAAWMLSLLFVRTLEDRGLLPARLKGGADHRAQLRALAPYLDDRDYLRLIFRELTRYRGVRDVFDAAHNPVWLVGPSPEMAAALLNFAGSEAGLGGFDFTGDTRFLGDVYEQLDEGVRKRYALLQTPDFVEAFILDQTLTPALAARGVDGLTLIDPTCGSGHFLLGAFARLRAAWAEKAPGADAEMWAFKAVHQVYGADINPYAVAIARFRLVLAYLEAAGCTSLADARDLRLNVAVADSLLPVDGAEQPELASVLPGSDRARWHANPFSFAQSADAERVLGRTFDVVVGNPPYIIVQDPVLREVYRREYPSASGKYQLVVPFIERFFKLASDAGWVGAIVGNAFMKRSFGKKLIEKFLPTIDLTSVVDTSGAYIPGHGTPTVILFGRHREPATDQVLAVMGKRGEPSTPEDPASGLVWAGIRDHYESVGFENDYISVDQISRGVLAEHPWSLKGGGAAALKARIEDACAIRLTSIADSVGISAVTGEDAAYILPLAVATRSRVESSRELVTGEQVRDWTNAEGSHCLFMYSPELELVPADQIPRTIEYLWPYRARLLTRKRFGVLMSLRGLAWYELQELYSNKLKTPLTITFAFVATHNHFVLDRGGKVFNRSAPIIKLPPDATEDDHLALLGYLNSSTACFWMKQVFYPKASGINDISTIKNLPENNRYEFAATGLQQLPIPAALNSLTPIAKQTDAYACKREKMGALQAVAAAATGSTADDLREVLKELGEERRRLRGRLIHLQEELDWQVYALMGLAPAADPLPLDLEVKSVWRPFLWGEGPPEDLPGALAQVYLKRHRLITESKELRLLETKVHKRLWLGTRGVFGHGVRTWDDRCKDALAAWLLDRIESEIQSTPTPQSIREIARTLRADPKVNAVAQVYTDQADPDLEPLFATLVASESVPYLAALRYKPSGLVKYRAWQATWAAQRREDAGETVDVPLPPKYKSSDFLRTEYWRQRGKLDVPKERFIAYPGVEDEDNPTPVIGWAGWDHADRIAALGGLIDAQPTPARRVPLLAGMHELLPWVLQWHGDDDRYGTPLGAMWRDHLQGMLTAQQLTEQDLEAWRPVKATKARRPRAPKVTVDALIAAFEELATPEADGVKRSALAKALGVSGAAVGKAAHLLLDDGRWTIIKQRPLTYALEPDA